MAGEEPSGGAEQPRSHEPTPEGGSGERAPETAGPRAMPLGALATHDLLLTLLGLLVEKAWAGMGLVPDPATGKLEKNLEDARIAIDAYAAILEVVRAKLDNAPRREMETLLTTLRLNFVEKSSGLST